MSHLHCGQVLVDDQDKALRFYTEKLGFVKVLDVPDGDSGMRSLMVEPPDGIPGVGLELMATYTPAARLPTKLSRPPFTASAGKLTTSRQMLNQSCA